MFDDEKQMLEGNLTLTDPGKMNSELREQDPEHSQDLHHIRSTGLNTGSTSHHWEYR